MMKKHELGKITKKFEKAKEARIMKEWNEAWEDSESSAKSKDSSWNGRPIAIVRKFIIDKGLKIYGGLALNELLKKKKKPIYGPNEFPDYDVFSPNAWEHAKELCDILVKSGYQFVEARGSILNDEHHQTYKVGVDYLDILDLTQVGCPKNNLINNECDECGLSKDGKCISIFNHIPAYDINANFKTEPQIYKKVYNYDTNNSMFINKLFVCVRKGFLPLHICAIKLICNFVVVKNIYIYVIQTVVYISLNTASNLFILRHNHLNTNAAR